MKLLRFYIVLILLLAGNASFAQTNTDVVVLPVKMAAPAGAEKVGTIKVGNNSTNIHCDYEEMVNKAKEKARAMHGNVVKITELAEPAFVGKCYKIVADVYRANDISPYKALIATDRSAAPANTNYAVVYLYRLKDSLALMTSYHVHLNNDSVIYDARKRSADSIRIYDEGPITLWGKTEKRTELKINVRFGESYYVRCGLVKGEIRMNPVLQLVDKNLGRTEYRDINGGKRDVSVKYLYEVH